MTNPAYQTLSELKNNCDVKAKIFHCHEQNTK